MKDFPKKVLDKIPDGIADEIEKMTEVQLRDKIVKTEALLVDTDKEVSEDPKIATLKEDLKAIMSGHKEIRTGAQAIIKFCVFNLRKQGHSLK